MKNSYSPIIFLYIVCLGFFSSCLQNARENSGNVHLDTLKGPFDSLNVQKNEKIEVDSDNQTLAILNETNQGSVSSKHILLKDMFGINAFEWDFLQDPKNPGIADKIFEPKVQLIKSFSAVRQFLDWDKIEDSQGLYTFSPTRRGGWDYDLMYERCKEEGIFISPCIQSTPDWMYNSYPQGMKDHDVPPVFYKANREKPESYLALAKAGFQFAARYGTNSKIDSSMIHLVKQQRWFNDRLNKIRLGLNLIKYVECRNEPDKWWKGKSVQQTGRQYAANLSAFYDGHKGTLGPGVGVKTADPNMQVVMGGLAKPDVNFVKEMVEWCKENRGYHKDGSVNLCFDVLNFHMYSNDNISWFNKLFRSSSHGKAPELSDQGLVADEFIKLSGQLKNMPVWTTEVGYDLDERSAQRAIAIGSKSPEMVQADWIVRTGLNYARHGVDRVFYYQLYDAEPKGQSSGYPFGHSGLVQDGKRRIAADYILQINNAFGQYHYTKTISSEPFVDLYENGSKKMYVMVVPDEIDKKENFQLELGTTQKVLLKYLKPGSGQMASKEVAVNGGKLLVHVTETPLFVELL
ncbi:hypothetical protein SAMN05216436_11857 [bacterium A37T11]|nr:hypothetical protein SAMN05216436_11857 [bacterium A37T11]